MRKSLFSVCLAALAVLSACEKPETGDDGKNTGNEDGGQSYSYTLIASPQSLSFGWSDSQPQTITVTTNAPDGYTVGETADWYTAESSGSTVTVTVEANSGEARSHDLVISATDANPVTVRISQAAAGEVDETLLGQKYIVWQLDQITAELLADRIALSFSVFYIWDDTFTGEDSKSMRNFYGNMTGFMALQVSGITNWSGAGWIYAPAEGEEDLLTPLSDEILADNGEGWYFHAGIKGTPGAGNYLQICGKSDAANYIIRWDEYETLSENDWTEIEIPMTDIINAGWSGFPINTNTVSVGSSSNAGDKLHMDAVFIYKK